MFRHLLIILPCIKVTAGSLFHQVDDFEFEYELTSCTSTVISRLRTERRIDSVNLYSSNASLSQTSLLADHFFNLNPPLPLFTMNIDDFQDNFFTDKRFCVILITTKDELHKSLRRLYYNIPHNYCVICISFFVYQYPFVDPIKYLSLAIGLIWTRTFPRNLVFVIRYPDEFEVLGAPGYSSDTCSRVDLIKLANCQHGRIVSNLSYIYPAVRNMHGCDLRVALQQPVLPYVEKMDDNPKGTLGHFITETALILNFTPRYSWASVDNLLVKSLAINDDVDISIDATIISSAMRRDISVYLMPISMAWVVPLGKHFSVLNMLLVPFSATVWILIGTIFLIVFSLLFVLGSDGKYDRSKLFLIFFGICLGIGTDIKRVPKNTWFRLLLYHWMILYTLGQIYLASLTGTFTKPPPNVQIETIEDLLKSNLDIICPKVFNDMVCEMTDDVSKRTCERCKVLDKENLMLNYYLLMKHGSLDNKALIFDLETLKSYSVSADIHIVKNWTYPIPVFLTSRIGTDFITNIRNVADNLLGNGLYQYWESTYTSTRKTENFDPSYDVLRWKYFVCGCITVLVGYLISFIVFLIEIVVHRLRFGRFLADAKI